MKSKMWKRSMVVALMLAVTVSGTPGSVITAGAQAVGQKQVNHKEVRDADGTIEDLGYFIDEDTDEVVITGYYGNEKNLVIPEEIEGKKVKRISDGAFEGYSNLQSINVPDSITEIGSFSF